jgi:hypothetical protein
MTRYKKRRQKETWNIRAENGKFERERGRERGRGSMKKRQVKA